MTAEAHALVRFRRAIERRALWAAEDGARELPNLRLEDALQLVHLYADRGSPKDERAAMRWLERYLTEGSPRLQHFAEITASLTKREVEPDAPPVFSAVAHQASSPPACTTSIWWLAARATRSGRGSSGISTIRRSASTNLA